MTTSVEEKLAAVPLRVTDREKIPAKRYYDPEFFELERKHLWPHVWQMAARLEEIPNVGDWVEYKILDKSVIVVRAKDGVKAFHNACRHRGVKLASGHGNCEVQGFICPFHGWRWNIEGENTFVYARNVFDERMLDAAELNLVPCRVETWGGCAFINFDNDAPSYRSTLGPVADRLEARNIGEMKMEWWRATILPTNWKLAMEAFMEGYHTARTHPQLLGAGADQAPVMNRSRSAGANDASAFFDASIGFMRRLSDGMQGEIHASEVAVAETLRDMPLPDDRSQWDAAFQTRLKEEIRVQGNARGLNLPDMNKIDTDYPFTPVEFLFPHYFLLPTYSVAASYRIRPLTPETCLFELFSLAPMVEGEPHERVREPTYLAYDSAAFPEIPRQDYSNLPLQQVGLHAEGFEFMRLSKETEGLISNYHRLIDGYLAGVDRERLHEAVLKVTGSFNVPVADIGF